VPTAGVVPGPVRRGCRGVAPRCAALRCGVPCRVVPRRAALRRGAPRRGRGADAARSHVRREITRWEGGGCGVLAPIAWSRRGGRCARSATRRDTPEDEFHRLCNVGTPV